MLHTRSNRRRIPAVAENPITFAVMDDIGEAGRDITLPVLTRAYTTIIEPRAVSLPAPVHMAALPSAITTMTGLISAGGPGAMAALTAASATPPVASVMSFMSIIESDFPISEPIRVDAIPDMVNTRDLFWDPVAVVASDVGGSFMSRDRWTPRDARPLVYLDGHTPVAGGIDLAAHMSGGGAIDEDTGLPVFGSLVDPFFDRLHAIARAHWAYTSVGWDAAAYVRPSSVDSARGSRAWSLRERIIRASAVAYRYGITPIAYMAACLRRLLSSPLILEYLEARKSNLSREVTRRVMRLDAYADLPLPPALAQQVANVATTFPIDTQFGEVTAIRIPSWMIAGATNVSEAAERILAWAKHEPWDGLMALLATFPLETEVGQQCQDATASARMITPPAPRPVPPISRFEPQPVATDGFLIERSGSTIHDMQYLVLAPPTFAHGFRVAMAYSDAALREWTVESDINYTVFDPEGPATYVALGSGDDRIGYQGWRTYPADPAVMAPLLGFPTRASLTAGVLARPAPYAHLFDIPHLLATGVLQVHSGTALFVRSPGTIAAAASCGVLMPAAPQGEEMALGYNGVTQVGIVDVSMPGLTWQTNEDVAELPFGFAENGSAADIVATAAGVTIARGI